MFDAEAVEEITTSHRPIVELANILSFVLDKKEHKEPSLMGEYHMSVLSQHLKNPLSDEAHLMLNEIHLAATKASNDASYYCGVIRRVLSGFGFNEHSSQSSPRKIKLEFVPT